MLTKTQLTAAITLISVSLIGAGCQTSNVAGEKGSGDLDVVWQGFANNESLLTVAGFSVSFRNDEERALTNCQFSFDGIKNDLSKLLVHDPNPDPSMSKYYSDSIDRVEPGIWYEIGHNSDSSSFPAGTNAPSDPKNKIQKVKLECDGKSSEWQIK